MATNPETALTRELMIYLRALGMGTTHVLKIHGDGMQTKDIDLVGGMYYAGRRVPFAFEVKTGEGLPTRLQAATIRAWQRAGFCSGVVRSKTDVLLLIEDYITTHGKG